MEELNIKDIIDSFGFAIIVVGGSIAIITLLFGLISGLIYLTSIITGVPIPTY